MSYEKFCSQELIPGARYRVENERRAEKAQNSFQISVNIWEGQKLSTGSQAFYIIVGIDKVKYRTALRKGYEKHYFGEHFTFEMYGSASELKICNLWLAAMELQSHSAPLQVGEASVSLAAVWAQPSHEIVQKWVELRRPHGKFAACVGYVKIDVDITPKCGSKLMGTVAHNIVKDDLLLSKDKEQQQAAFIIKIFNGFGLSNDTRRRRQNAHKKASKIFVRVSFCGLVVNTTTRNGSIHPSYNEKVTIVEMFPNVNHKVTLEVYSVEDDCPIPIATSYLSLPEISHSGENGFLPTFGPSLLHIYGPPGSCTNEKPEENGPYYRGALLVSLETIVPYYERYLRTVDLEPCLSICMENNWLIEGFCVFCPIFETSMLDPRIVSKCCGVAITIGELLYDISPENEEAQGKRKLHYTGHMAEVINCKDFYGYLEFDNVFPVLQLLTLLPDYRFRMYRNNALNNMVDGLEQVLNEIDSQLKKDPNIFECMALELRNALTSTTKDIKMLGHSIRCSHTVCGERPFCQCLYMSHLDRRLAALDKQETENIVYRIKGTLDLIPSLDTTHLGPISKRTIKTILKKARDIVLDMRSLVSKAPEGWPDVLVWILNGGSRVAYTRISAADVIYSLASNQRGRDCGKIQTLYLKPVKCLMHTSSNCKCIVGKVELQMWMGLYREKSDFENFRLGYSISGKGLELFYKGYPQILELRAYIHRAKLKECYGNSFVRVNAMSMVKESELVSHTKEPIWNQLIRLQKTVYYTAERLRASPPIALIEVYATDNRSNQQLIGRTEIRPTFDEDLNACPSLQWHNLAKGAIASGKIFMTVQIVQIPEDALKSTTYSKDLKSLTYSPCDVQETCYEYNVPLCLQGENYLEPLPEYLIPKYINYRIEVYWWGLREVNVCRKPCVVLEIEDVLIKSDVLTNSRTNCNFPNGIPTEYLETYNSELDYTPIYLKLYDNTTFGRTILLGMNVIDSHKKYIVDWLTKNERDSLLQTCRVAPANYIQVNECLYVKKVLESRDNITTNRSGSSMKKIITKISNMNCSKVLDEEQYSLLPVFPKRADDGDVASPSKNVIGTDWWEKYHSSQREYGDDVQPNRCGRITIYESELESQPEFGKFRDWCSAFRLYSDSGVGDRDRKVCCAIVKVGIALYQWPPPLNTTAVDKCGVDLSYGFFQNFPKNNPEKIVVRVYAISGSFLQTNETDSKSNPYVIVNCGRKQMGDQGDCVDGTCEPIFGKLYEFRCTLPDDYLLTLSVFDHDINSTTDKLIGSTKIDLENRYYTKHKARVGLSTTYNGSGPSRWRDCIRPSQILEDLCVDNNIQKPVFTDTSIIMNGIEYKYCEMGSQCQSLVESRENACLDLLHKWQTLHLCGYRLVPEHVETRTLYNHDETLKGSIRMWVDIYPVDNDVYIPPPYNVTHRKTNEYELRLEVLKVKLSNFHRHYQKTSTARIFAKAWLGNAGNMQKTDIVFAKCTSEIPIHWRMIFQFKYQYADRKMLVERFDHFNGVKTEDRLPPVLQIVLIDLDRPGDEKIGYISLNLCSIPRGSSCVDICKSDVMHLADQVDLFSKGSVQGWWPLAAAEGLTARDQISEAAIEMALTVLPREKAILMPVPIGRDRQNSISDLRYAYWNILNADACRAKRIHFER